VFAGLEDQVVCFDCRPGPPTEQLDLVQTELALAPTELLNLIRPEEHLAGPRKVGSQPAALFAESDPAPAETPPVDTAGPDTEVLAPGPLEAPPPGSPPVEPPPAGPPLEAPDADSDLPGVDLPGVDPPRADVPRADSPRANSPRAKARRAKAAAPVAGAPHRRALRRRPEVPARGRLKDDVQGPLIILAVLCAIVAVVGGLNHNSFLGLTGGMLSGAAIVAVIIIGLTSPK